MSETNIEELLDKMFDHFGTLPSPEHEPKRFAWYVKVFKYYQNRNT